MRWSTLRHKSIKTYRLSNKPKFNSRLIKPTQFWRHRKNPLRRQYRLDEEPATLNLDLKEFPLLDAEDEKLLEQKLKLMQQNPDAFIERLVGSASSDVAHAPVLGTLLKLCYPFSKHYYIEHLAVALHTHAFLLLSFMMLTITDSSAAWLSTQFDYPWIDELASYAENILLMWMVAYLLFTQKLFYQQSWPMTLFKFFICSFIYVFLIAAAFLALVVLGLLSS